MTVYTDRLGRKALERRGPENKKGMNDTYFVYNALGQLRYVLTPGYELSGYKDRFAYEYRYDDQGNVVKKFIPDAGYTQYWYDRAGRLSFMQDPNLREAGYKKFDSKIVEDFPAGRGARGKALEAEKKNAERLKKEGHLKDEKYHKRP